MLFAEEGQGPDSRVCGEEWSEAAMILLEFDPGGAQRRESQLKTFLQVVVIPTWIQKLLRVNCNEQKSDCDVEVTLPPAML